MAEGMKVSRDLPGYSWARDGKSLVIAQGGRIRRVDVASGRWPTIPSPPRVQRTISEMAGRPFDLTESTFPVKFPRWTTSSPDGSRLAFQAAGRIYVMDLPIGHAPAADDRAHSSRSRCRRRGRRMGELDRVCELGRSESRASVEDSRGDGGDAACDSRRLPVSSSTRSGVPTGSTIVATRGSGATAHGAHCRSELVLRR